MATMLFQSVSSALRAREWQAAIAACSVYLPAAPPVAYARSNAASPRPISIQSQRERSWSSRRIGSPFGPTRARAREACSSISADSPCTSGSPGSSAASMRPSRSPSSSSSGRIHSLPAVAA